MAARFYKFIVTHGIQYGVSDPDPERQKLKPWTHHGNAFVIGGGIGMSFAAYRQMVTEVRKDFPSLTDEEITLGLMVERGGFKGCPILSFSVPPFTKMDGWESIDPDADGRVNTLPVRWL